MNKNEFIKELKQALSVLQEDELNDILGEYEQHIDMKVQKGQTEEAAIADFGSLSELASDILEAYHVRSDYAKKHGDKKKPFFIMKESSGQEMLQQTSEACKKAGGKTAAAAKSAFRWLWAAMGAVMRQLFRPIDRMKQWFRKPEGKEELHSVSEDVSAGLSGSGRKIRGSQGLCGLLFHGAQRIWNTCIRVLSWCVRITWNICWVGFSLICVFMGLFCLYGLGMLTVLLTQGYPLAGVTLGCLGLTICLFAVTGLAFTCLIRSGRTGGKQKVGSAVDHNPEYEKLEGEQHA